MPRFATWSLSAAWTASNTRVPSICGAAFKNAESEPFYLQADDIVYVPRTKIDRVDQWVDQYMNQPVPRWLTATVDVNNIIRNNKAEKPASVATYSTATNGLEISAPR